MYKIGDSVVYPMHGAGVIEDIEQKEVLGKQQSYYVMRIPIGDMKVMIPSRKVITYCICFHTSFLAHCQE